MSDNTSLQPKADAERNRFITRVAIAVGALALAFLIWQIRHAVVLAFGGVVAAVILCAIADPLVRRTGMRRAYAVLVAFFLILCGLALFAWIAMPQASRQWQDLVEALPTSLAEVDRLVGEWVPEGVLGGGMVGMAAQHLAAWSTALFTGVTTFILVVAAGAFFAIRPGTYRDGLVSLFAPMRQPGLRRALDHTGEELKGWLKAQLISMTVIGTAVAGSTWALGLPSPLVLGLIAGLLEFVPILGPIVAAIPALLLALAMSPTMVLWTGLAYFAIEQVESNLVLPMAQHEVADVPPALLIFAFVAFGAVFGLAGVIVSAPLAVALLTLTEDLYVKPMNGEG